MKATNSSTRLLVAPVPKEYIPAVDKGIQEADGSGVLAGYPVVDVKVTLYDGSYHDVDSKRDGIQDRRLHGLSRQARAKCQAGLLEPIMGVEIVTPDDYMGDVNGDLNRRRGMSCRAWTSRRQARSSSAEVPLAEMFGYATDLRSMSQGRATYSMEFGSLR